MRNCVIAAFVSVAAILTGAAAPAWTHHSYPALGVAIDMPCEPALQNTTTSAEVGAAPMTIATCDLGAEGVIIWSAADYRSLNATTDADQALELAVGGAMEAMKGTLDSKIKIEFKGAPGREVTFHANDIVGKLRLIYSDKRLTQVLALGRGKLPSADYDRTAGSVVLLP